MWHTGKRNLRYLLALFFLVFIVSAYSQSKPGLSPLVREQLISVKESCGYGDSIMILKNLVVSLCDSQRFCQRIIFCPDSIYVSSSYEREYFYDTTVIRQDTVYSFNQKVFKKIEQISNKDNILGKIFSSVLIFDKTTPYPGNRPDPQPEASLKIADLSFLMHEDKIIDSVKIVVLDPLGYEISDVRARPRSLLEKSGNFIHMRSKKLVIRNRLLFSEGEALNPFLLAESERLLRGLRAIYDARVVVRERTDTRDTVDVLVTVQDIFSISAGVGIDFPRQMGDASIQEANFLGLGHFLEYRYKYNPLMPGKHNHLLSYSVGNISNSFVGVGGFYRIQAGERSTGIGVNRDLVTSSINLIGGVNFRTYEFPYRQGLTIDPAFQRDTISFFQNDIWLGHASNLFISKEKANKGKRFVVAGRVLSTNYQDVPSDNWQRNTPLQDSRLYLASAGVFFRRTYKDRYIFRYGRTEDIPEGYYYSLIGGVQQSQLGKNPYAGAIAGWGKYVNRVGYFFNAVGAGAFKEGTALDRGVFTVKGLYFTPIIRIKNWKLRQFAAIRATTGVNQPDAILEINNNQGVRGFYSFDLRGEKKLVVNLESNIFAPFNLVGFRFAFVAFADLAWIDTEAFSKKFFPGYGIGLKFRNDHLIFDAVQILIGYYPNAHLAGAKNLHFFQRSYSFFTFNDFNYSRPGMLPFN